MKNYERLKERFLKCGLEGFDEEEIAAFALMLAGEKEDAVHKGGQLVGAFGGLENTLSAQINELSSYVSYESATLLSFMGKIGRRICREKKEGITILTSLDIIDYAQRLLGQSRTEILTAVFLDYGGNVLSHAQYGGEANNFAAVSVRSILKLALQTNCSKLFLAHNHPAGGGASKRDIDFTNKLFCTLKSADIALLDHVILGKGVYSFYDKGLISKMEEEYARAYGKY